MTPQHPSAPVLVGQTITAQITDLTATGEGVAHIDGFTVFVEGAVPGDTVQATVTTVKAQYALAETTKILTPSSGRAPENPCPHAGTCGGCSYYNLTYGAQLEAKYRLVADALKKIGGFEKLNISPVLASKPWHYRNKAQYKCGKDGLGFYKKKTHDVIPVANCRLQSENNARIAALIGQIIKDYHLSLYDENTHQGLLRGVLTRTNRCGQTMVVFIINAKKLPDAAAIAQTLMSDPDIVSVYQNTNTSPGNVVLGKDFKLLAGAQVLSETLGDKTFELSPSAFFQVNTEQTEVLYDTVKAFADLKPGETLYDLYCGTGTIGLYIAQPGVKLYGVELNKQAVQDARRNAARNHIDATFLAGKAEIIAPELSEKPDCVVLDPPRKGCDKTLLDLLLKLKAPRIVYVSCNPATLARDLKILSTAYTVEKVQPVDLFPQTGHVETVVLLTKLPENTKAH